MKKSDYTFNGKKDKAVMFFSASSTNDAQQLYNFGIREILVSYHYISKSFKFYTEFLPKLKSEGGLFMSDSGAFSVLHSTELTDEHYTRKYWEPYIEKYVAWLYENKEYIYCAANFDIEQIVGYETVDAWNKQYFEPLEQYMQIVYVPHGQDHTSKSLRDRFEYYCTRYDYVGVPSGRLSYANAAQLYYIGNRYGSRLHGFGWTSIPTLKTWPFFSVDSTTWLGGVRYGTSYNYDGKNFRVNDYKKKYIRKGDKVLCREFGINHENLVKEKRIEVNQYNLIGWLGARKEFLRSANLKLSNKHVRFYTK